MRHPCTRACETNDLIAAQRPRSQPTVLEVLPTFEDLPGQTRGMIDTQLCPTRVAVTPMRVERIKGGEIDKLQRCIRAEEYYTGLLAWFTDADKARMLQAGVTVKRHRLILRRCVHGCDCTYALISSRSRFRNSLQNSSQRCCFPCGSARSSASDKAADVPLQSCLPTKTPSSRRRT